jgi:hypothetical protein
MSLRFSEFRHSSGSEEEEKGEQKSSPKASPAPPRRPMTLQREIGRAHV